MLMEGDKGVIMILRNEVTRCAVDVERWALCKQGVLKGEEYCGRQGGVWASIRGDCFATLRNDAFESFGETRGNYVTGVTIIALSLL